MKKTIKIFIAIFGGLYITMFIYSFLYMFVTGDITFRLGIPFGTWLIGIPIYMCLKEE